MKALRILLCAGALVVSASILYSGVYGPGPNSTTVPSTGQSLSVIITQPPDNSTHPIPPGTVEVQGNCAIGTVAGQPINLMYVVDVSGSTDLTFMLQNGVPLVDADGSGTAGNAGDNFNAVTGDTESGEVLDGEISGVLALHSSIGNPNNVNVGVVAFATNASRADVKPTAPNTGPITQVFATPPQADLNLINGPDITEVLRSLRSEHSSGGSIGKFTPVGQGTIGNNTRFPQALQAMNAALLLFPTPATNIVFFLSDGESNSGFRCFQGACSAQLAAAVAAGTKINTVGVGMAADPVDLQFIATQTGGTFVQVTNPSLLFTVLPTITPAGLLDHAVVNGNDVMLDALGNFTTTVPCNGTTPFDITATCIADDPLSTNVLADVTVSCFYLCGNGVTDPLAGEECDPPNTPTCDANCQRVPTCGDGFTDPPEQCEPPNTINCDAICHLIACGNGQVQPGEECEPPSTSTCNAFCQRVPMCGDGFTDAPEGCDPPDGTTCDTDCTPFACGNGDVEPGEECEPPSTVTCNASCQRVPVCGDGFLDGPEVCDPPEDVTCDTDCTPIMCGNGDVEPGEECEPRNTVTCNGTCQRVASCGDGFLDSPEECEPPNTGNCDAACQLISCGNGSLQPGEECEPPNTATCDLNCQRVPICPDGNVDAPEQCDPPNGTTCDTDCTFVACGNGDVEPGEECDPPNTPTCNASCQRVQICGDGFTDAPEECEPPNGINCDANCLLIACGNGQIQPGEECEPPNTPTCNASCQRVPMCGDGFTDPPTEQCEPRSTPSCSAVCRFNEQCSNEVDDDEDGLIDCLDPNCPPCPPLQRDPAIIKFDASGNHRDTFRLHATFLPLTPIDPSSEEVGILLSNNHSIVYRTTLSPGLLVGSSGAFSSRFKFSDRSHSRADGVVKIRIRRHGHDGSYALSMKVQANLSEADEALMTLSWRVGDDEFIHTRPWLQTSKGWFLPLN